MWIRVQTELPIAIFIEEVMILLTANKVQVRCYSACVEYGLGLRSH